MLKSLRSRASKKVRSRQLLKASRRPRLEQLELRAMMACDGFTTFTQGGWGADPNGGNAGVYLHSNFTAAFPNGVQIGSQTAGAASDSVVTAGNQAAKFTSAQAITNWLPHGGPSGALGGDTVNPLLGSAPDDGTLAGQTLALSLNVGFDLYDANFSESTVHLKDLEVSSGPFAGQTVQFVLNTANAILSGITNTGYSAAEANTAATAINQNFDNGDRDLGYLDDDCIEDSPLFVALSGRKFEDLNGNGADDSDPGIANWQISVWLDSNGNSTHEAEETHVVTTNLDGDWTFAEEVPHSDHPVAWTVFEINQAGWTQTYGTAGYSGTFSENDRFEAGIDFGNFKNFSLSGTKFEDRNGDGLTAGDSGLGGITIFIDMNDDTISNEGDATTTTAADGTWSFNGLSTGYAGKKVLEVLPSGYTQTLGAAGYVITGTSGADQTGLNFANFKNFNLSGTKFEDHNGDGLTTGDSGLGGITIFIDMNGDTISNDGAGTTTTTAADGSWSFNGLSTGYAGKKVLEVLPSGYTQTLGAAGYVITGTSGADQTGLNFANFKNFNLSGTKFEDHNGDGLTTGDSGLGGITIFIDMNGDTISNDGAGTTTTTAADGSWSFNGLGTGYAGKKVLEVLPSGYTQTLGAAGYAIAGTSGADQTGLNFANFKNINISGTKYQDHNGNGVKDGADGALGNFTFILNDNGDGIVNNGERFAVSAADGTWSITNVGPGTWTITEAYAGANWVQTQGETGYSAAASSGVNAIDLIFGNTDVGVENGKTIGFWSNKNGQALITASDITALNGYNLKTATGADAVFTNAASVKSFMLGATATNMANMLSAQLAGTVLNFRHGFFGSSTSIYVDGTLSTWGGNSQGVNLVTNLDNDGDANNSDADGLVNQFGFADINGLIAAANAELAAHANTTSGSTFDAFRKYQEALKIAFDGMNNNLTIFAL